MDSPRATAHRVPTKATFSKRTGSPRTEYTRSPGSGDSAASYRRCHTPSLLTLSEGSAQPEATSPFSTPVGTPTPSPTEYTVGFYMPGMDDYPFGLEPEFPPPDPNVTIARPAPDGRGGNTLVSIPIPISVPLPLGQSGGGGQSGPIIITSPAPPNPSPPPPPPPTPQPGVSQDMASMLMLLVMNHVRERMEGMEDMEEMKQREAAKAKDEPMVPISAVLDMVPAALRRAKMAKKKKARDKELLRQQQQQQQPEGLHATVYPPLVLPFPDQEPSQGMPTTILRIKPLEETDSPSPEDRRAARSESPSDENGWSHQEDTYRVTVPCCDRMCCYLMILVVLAAVLAINVAFLVAPKKFTEFLCELGLGENSTQSRQGALENPPEADNSTELAPTRRPSRRRPKRHTGARVAFDINEPETEAPELPRKDIFESEDGSATVMRAISTEQHHETSDPLIPAEESNADRHFPGIVEEDQTARSLPQVAFEPPAHSPYLDEDSAFRAAWYAFAPAQPPPTQEGSGSYLDKEVLRLLRARRPKRVQSTSNPVPVSSPEIGLLNQQFGAKSEALTTKTTRKRAHHDRLDAMMAVAASSSQTGLTMNGRGTMTTDATSPRAVTETSTATRTSPFPPPLAHNVVKGSADTSTNSWFRVLVVPRVDSRPNVIFV